LIGSGLQDWLAALEQLTVIQAVKASFFTYPLINAAHIMAIGALITSVVLMDLRLLGWLTSLPETAAVRLFRNIAFAAFAVAAMTGAILFAVRAPDYAASRLFWLKLALVIAAGVNAAVFLRMQKRGLHRSVTGRISLLLSMIIWPAVLITGRFLGFV
jgi:hypothetical protein